MSKHLSEDAMQELINLARTQVTIGETYQHYRGNLYKVLELGIFTEDSTEVGVVYQAQYGQRLVFIRPLTMWNEIVEHESKQVPRFKEIELLQER